MVTRFLHWYKHLCWDVRVPVIWLLTLLSNVDLALARHRSPVPDIVTESGVALVANNHARDRVARDLKTLPGGLV